MWNFGLACGLFAGEGPAGGAYWFGFFVVVSRSVVGRVLVVCGGVSFSGCGAGVLCCGVSCAGVGSIVCALLVGEHGVR